jgi:hypothetical protein
MVQLPPQSTHQSLDRKSISSRLGSPGRNPALFSAGWMKNLAWGGPFSQRRAQGKTQIQTELDKKRSNLGKI